MTPRAFLHYHLRINYGTYSQSYDSFLLQHQFYKDEQDDIWPSCKLGHSGKLTFRHQYYQSLISLFFGHWQVAKSAGAKHGLPRTASSVTAVSANRTTSSSNAAVISSKRKIPNQSSDHHHAGPSHGFLEEDELEERKAALSSPIKGGKRLSSAVSTRLFIFQFFLTTNVLGYRKT